MLIRPSSIKVCLSHLYLAKGWTTARYLSTDRAKVLNIDPTCKQKVQFRDYNINYNLIVVGYYMIISRYQPTNPHRGAPPIPTTSTKAGAVTKQPEKWMVSRVISPSWIFKPWIIFRLFVWCRVATTCHILCARVHYVTCAKKVLSKQPHSYSSGFIIFRFVSTQIWRNIIKMCLLDGSRNHQSWGFTNFHDFWVTLGVIWSHLDGSAKEVEILGTLVHVLDIRQKKLDGSIQ